MNDRNKKTFTIIALAVAILLIGIGYAALQQNLIINGTANIGDAKWDVKITNIEATSLNGASLVEEEGVTNPSFTDTSATFNVDLEYPGASAEFAVTVTNAGSIDAILNSITGVEAANSAAPIPEFPAPIILMTGASTPHTLARSVPLPSFTDCIW